MMSKTGKILIFIVTVAAIVLFLIEISPFSPLKDIREKTDLALENIKKDIILPPPLRATQESDNAYLTRGGVMKWTNVHRADADLSALKENPQLNIAARLKVQDMFDRQYFEHVSPTGGNIGTLLDGVGYAYIVVGENLALGNYKNDEALVQAWMDSPGHRANILNSRFKEIGVAVARGSFEGRQTWLAVQAFASPLSDCPQPDETLKAKITLLESQVDELKNRAEIILSEIENMQSKRGQEYNKKVDEYNTVVSQVNVTIAELKMAAAQYNDQIRAFNSCIGQ